MKFKKLIIKFNQENERFNVMFHMLSFCVIYCDKNIKNNEIDSPIDYFSINKSKLQ